MRQDGVRAVDPEILSTAAAGPLLETRGLTRRFGGLAAVSDVDLSVAPGEVRSIIGPNGAGKTTLFNVVTGALAPTAGRVVFEGRDVTGWRPADIFRAGIVRSFQVSHVFPKLSVRENVALMVHGRVRSSGSPFGRVRVPGVEVQARVARALDRLGIRDRAAELAGKLSHGDRRLVELAMAIAAGPRLRLHDEPTAGMSPEETRATAALLRALAPAITLVIVEHDMSVVMSISDRISVLHRGEILAEGRPEEIRANRAVQEVYLGAPVTAPA